MSEAPSRAQPWIGTSWKMTKTRSEADDYSRTLAAAAPDFIDAVSAFVLPAYPLIESVAATLIPAGFRVGSQNIHWEDSGAFTGEVSAPMLTELGATMTALGHAERRAMFAETDDTVRAKVIAALRNGMTPLICVGESAAVRADRDENPYVTKQVELALAGLSPEQVSLTMLAYEPVWAIGVGSTPATTEQADAMHTVIRGYLVDKYGEAGAGVPLLYGGSVNATQAPELTATPNIDGLFVGRAAWSADGFAELARIVASG